MLTLQPSTKHVEPCPVACVQADRHWRSSAHKEFGVSSFDSSHSSLGSISEDGQAAGQQRRSAEIARRKNAENAARNDANAATSTSSDALTKRNNSADDTQKHRLLEQDSGLLADSQTLSHRSRSMPGVLADMKKPSLPPIVQRSALYALLNEPPSAIKGSRQQ